MGGFYTNKKRKDISTVLSVQLSQKEVYDYSHPGYLSAEREENPLDLSHSVSLSE